MSDEQRGAIGRLGRLALALMVVLSGLVVAQLLQPQGAGADDAGAPSTTDPDGTTSTTVATTVPRSTTTTTRPKTTTTTTSPRPTTTTTRPRSTTTTSRPRSATTTTRPAGGNPGPPSTIYVAPTTTVLAAPVKGNGSTPGGPAPTTTSVSHVAGVAANGFGPVYLASPSPTPTLPATATGGPDANRTAPTTVVSPAVAAGGFNEPMVASSGGWRGPSLQAATTLKVPIAFGLVVGLFVLVQGLVDRRDPKLSRAPETGEDETVGFE